MKKFILFLIVQMFFTFSAAADDFMTNELIECVVDSCNGWEVRRDTSKKDYGNNNDIFYVYNNTGEPAFRIKIVIDSYDIFGEHMDRVEEKVEGPIFKKVVFTASLPRNLYDIKASVFYSKSLEEDSIKTNVLEAK